MNNNVLYGKKWAVCGDSFTNGDFRGYAKDAPVFEEGPFKGKLKTYGYLIGDRNGMQIQQIAVNGMTMATPSDDEFLNTFSGGLYKTIDADVDYITLYFGINDSHHRPRPAGYEGEVRRGTVYMGTIDDAGTDTFYGAWNVVMEYLITHHPFAHIGIIVSNGCENDDYRKAEIAIANKWGIPYIDMNGDSRTPVMGRSTNEAILKSVRDFRTRQFAVAYPHNTHPNEEAHAYESVFIENWLRSL